MPDPEPTVATPVPPLVHVPPEGDELRVVFAPVHTDAVPVIAPGVVLTVTGAIAKQPPLSVYVILTVPAELPETIPEPDPTVAIAVLALVQEPPEGEELNVVLAPVQTEKVPVIADGAVLTVTVLTAKQPPVSV